MGSSRDRYGNDPSGFHTFFTGRRSSSESSRGVANDSGTNFSSNYVLSTGLLRVTYRARTSATNSATSGRDFFLLRVKCDVAQNIESTEYFKDEV